jgi:hypothetical protein
VENHIVLYSEELSIGRGSEADLLERGWAGADGAEHLVASECKFDRVAGYLGGHRGENDVRPRGTLAAKPYD